MLISQRCDGKYWSWLKAFMMLHLQGPTTMSRSQYLQMCGRAGRAGLCKSGEAFLLGEGEAHSLAGNWQPICALLTADLPQITSQLMPSLSQAPALDGSHRQQITRLLRVEAGQQPAQAASASSSSLQTGQASQLQSAQELGASFLHGHEVANGSSSSAWVAERDCRHLQQLLLEAVAVGLVKTPHDVQRLLECTLIYTEASYPTIHATTMQALFKLSK